MNAPFYKFGLFGEEASFILAFVIGIGFGFFLERAGFGSSRKLAAQFYLRDLSVLKVMFTAIITAMVGVYVLSRLGLLDLSLVYLVPTFLAPQIVGGLVLGAGFVIGGYCPGTSCVSAATGRVDGMVYLAGMVTGLAGFAEVYPRIESFAHSTPMGQITLPRLLHLPYGLLVFAVVLMALGAFAAAEWAEGKFGSKVPEPDGSLTARPWRLTPIRVFALCLAAIGFVAVFAGDPYRGSHATVDTKDIALRVAKGADSIPPAQLADWIVQGRTDFALVDVRSQAAYAAYHIPSAQNVPLASLSPEFAAHNEKIVLCSEDGMEAAKAWFLLQAQGFKSAYILDGGLRSWKEQVLYPARPAQSSSETFARQIAIARFFGGAAREGNTASPSEEFAMPKVAVPALPAGAESPSKSQPRKKKEGC